MLIAVGRGVGLALAIWALVRFGFATDGPPGLAPWTLVLAGVFAGGPGSGLVAGIVSASVVAVADPVVRTALSSFGDGHGGTAWSVGHAAALVSGLLLAPIAGLFARSEAEAPTAERPARPSARGPTPEQLAERGELDEAVELAIRQGRPRAAHDLLAAAGRKDDARDLRQHVGLSPVRKRATAAAVAPGDAPEAPPAVQPDPDLFEYHDIDPASLGADAGAKPDPVDADPATVLFEFDSPEPGPDEDAAATGADERATRILRSGPLAPDLHAPDAGPLDLGIDLGLDAGDDEDDGGG